MEGYVLVLLAGICATLLNSSLKQFQSKAGNNFVSASVFLCLTALLSLPFLWWICCFVGEDVSVKVVNLWLPIAYALLYIVTFCLTMAAVRLGSLTIYTVYISAGMIFIPLLYGTVFLKEHIGIIEIICIMLSAVICFLPLFAKKGEEENKEKKSFYLVCFLAMTTNALTIVLSKMREQYCAELTPENYTFFSKAAVALFSGAVLIVSSFHKSEREKLKLCVGAKNFVFIAAGTALGIGNLLFLNISAPMLPVSVQSPLFSVFLLITTAAADKLIFKEKFTVNTIICLMLSVVAAILFSFTI